MNYVGRKNKILIVNDGLDCGSSYTPLFGEFGEVSNSISSFKLNPFGFKLVVFTGGSDVSPELYGDTSPQNTCRSDGPRDIEEIDVFKYADKRGIKMVGICRGLQFLNVMSGGKLIHDIQNHESGIHEVMTKDYRDSFITNTYHHQMCIPHESSHILAWSQTNLSREYIGNKDKPVDYIGPEVEALYMPLIKSIGVQWHPEVEGIFKDLSESSSWFKFLLDDFLKKSPYDFKRSYLGINGSKITTTKIGVTA